ncbi:MAG: AAA family ATPase, partial [bacterium]|nr:AAA family ATPase [bacterium]
MTRSETQSPITFSPEALEALRVMDTTDESVFVTGRAGTGKSTMLDWFRNHTKKKIVVLAPTGVAAVNVRGQTIHSFCKFGPDITLKKVKRFSADSDKYKLVKKLNAVVIDEISMARADLVDCVDKFLRLNGGDPELAFGGKQMIMIGDLYQLPPVVTSGDRALFTSRYPSP